MQSPMRHTWENKKIFGGDVASVLKETKSITALQRSCCLILQPCSCFFLHLGFYCSWKCVAAFSHFLLSPAIYPMPKISVPGIILTSWESCQIGSNSSSCLQPDSSSNSPDHQTTGLTKISSHLTCPSESYKEEDLNRLKPDWYSPVRTREWNFYMRC